jgi:hypothetical protein
MQENSKKMQKNNNKIERKLDAIILLLKDLLVIELKKLGKTQPEIQKIVKIDINRINQLVKENKQKKRAIKI